MSKFIRVSNRSGKMIVNLNYVILVQPNGDSGSILRLLGGNGEIGYRNLPVDDDYSNLIDRIEYMNGAE